MKTLIVYYSYSGNNEILAEALQKRLSCDLLRIEEHRKRWGISIMLDLIFHRLPRLKRHSVLLDLYQNFIFIAPIWAGKIASPLRSFLMNERAHIKTYSFISLCGGGEGQVEKIRKELGLILDTEPKVVRELWINNLLDPEKRNTIKYTTGYKLLATDLQRFDNEIEEFIWEQTQQSKMTVI